MSLVQLTANFSGRVQGVYFRDHVKKYADRLKITGYVKNLKDGSVDVIAVSAKKTTLVKFLQKINEKPGFGRVNIWQAEYEDLQENPYNSFEIIF